MPAQPTPALRRTEKLDVRLSPATKSKLQAAAAAAHRSMSDFVLESALSRADEVLADQTRFVLGDEQWNAFQALLDAPVRPLPRLKALLEHPGYFDK